MTSRSRKKGLAKDRSNLNDPVELDALWKEHGSAAIKTVRTLDPGAYLLAIARLVGEID